MQFFVPNNYYGAFVFIWFGNFKMAYHIKCIYSECPKTERFVCQTDPNLVRLLNVRLSNIRISDITGDQTERSVRLF